MYFSRVFPYIYLIVPLNIAGAAFRVLLIESLLSLCSFSQTDPVLTTPV